MDEKMEMMFGLALLPVPFWFFGTGFSVLLFFGDIYSGPAGFWAVVNLASGAALIIAGLVMILWIFGGFARKLYDDTRRLETDLKECQIERDTLKARYENFRDWHYSAMREHAASLKHA